MNIDSVLGTISGCVYSLLNLHLKVKYYCFYYIEAEIGTQRDYVVKTVQLSFLDIYSIVLSNRPKMISTS